MLLAGLITGWELLLIIAVTLILHASKRLPGLRRGFHCGMKEVNKASDDLSQAGHDAGESLGGIYGKRAYEALTPSNETAELYYPTAVSDKPSPKSGRFRLWHRLWRQLIRLLKLR